MSLNQAIAEVGERTFLGTYEMTGNGYRYLSVFDNETEKGYTYLAFNEDDKVIHRGNCEEGYRALSVVDEKSGDCIGSLVYSFGQFIYAGNGKPAAKVKQISDEPIIP